MFWMISLKMTKTCWTGWVITFRTLRNKCLQKLCAVPHQWPQQQSPSKTSPKSQKEHWHHHSPTAKLVRSISTFIRTELSWTVIRLDELWYTEKLWAEQLYTKIVREETTAKHLTFDISFSAFCDSKQAVIIFCAVISVGTLNKMFNIAKNCFSESQKWRQHIRCTTQPSWETACVPLRLRCTTNSVYCIWPKWPLEPFSVGGGGGGLWHPNFVWTTKWLPCRNCQVLRPKMNFAQWWL